jgi:Flp pilus assembly protein TadD
MTAFDLYLKAKEKIRDSRIAADGESERRIHDALTLLQQAVQLDPNHAIAYCLTAFAQDALYLKFDTKPDRRALGDEAINKALQLQADLPEVRLALANHFYNAYRDYEGARTQLAIARRGMPYSPEADHLEALMDRQQGKFESAIQYLNKAITLDPRDPVPISDLAEALSYMRLFSEAERTWDQLIALIPDQQTIRLKKEYFVTVLKTGDDAKYRSQLESLAASMPDSKLVLFERLRLAFDHRELHQAKELLDKINGDRDNLNFAYGQSPIPIGCYAILLARLQGDATNPGPAFAKTRQLILRKVETSSPDAPAKPLLLSDLAVVDACWDAKKMRSAKREALFKRYRSQGTAWTVQLSP